MISCFMSSLMFPSIEREFHGEVVSCVLARVDQREVPVIVVAETTLRQTVLPLSHLFGLSRVETTHEADSASTPLLMGPSC